MFKWAVQDINPWDIAAEMNGVSKTFVQKQTLKTHMIVHSPVKPFKCKVPDPRAPGQHLLTSGPSV